MRDHFDQTTLTKTTLTNHWRCMTCLMAAKCGLCGSAQTRCRRIVARRRGAWFGKIAGPTHRHRAQQSRLLARSHRHRDHPPQSHGHCPGQAQRHRRDRGPRRAYSRIVLDKEAAEMAHWLNPTASPVLLMQYRLPAEGHVNGRDAPADAQRRSAWCARMPGSGACSRTRSASSADPRRAIWVQALAPSLPRRSMPRWTRRTAFRRDRLPAPLYPVASMEDKFTHMEFAHQSAWQGPLA